MKLWAFVIGIVLVTAACTISGTGPNARTLYVATGDPHAGDEAFREKIAACSTEGECSALTDEARDRYDRCAKGKQFNEALNDCKPQNQDVLAIQGRIMSIHSQAKRDREVARDTEYRRDAHAVDEFNTRLRKLQASTSCEDIQALETIEMPDAGSIPRGILPDLADVRRRAGYERKTQTTFKIEALHRVTGRQPTNLRNVDDLSTAHVSLAQVQPLLDQLRCFDPDAAQAEQTNAEAWVAAREAMITDEQACRSAPGCMDRRAAETICEAIAHKAQAIRDIAHERSNPSGYVDVTALHGLGADVQNDDERIRDGKKEFAESQHHGFTEALCIKPKVKTPCAYPAGMLKQGIKSPIIGTPECGDNGMCMPSGFCK